MNTSAKLAGALLLSWSFAATLGFAQDSPFEATTTPQVEKGDARAEVDELLRRARKAMKGGNLELAERFVSQAEKRNVKYQGFLSRFSDTPSKARRDLNRLKQADEVSNPTRAKTLLGGQQPQAPSRLPQDSSEEPGPLNGVPYSAAGQPTSPQAEAQARSIMAQAKAAFDRGDLPAAQSMTQQAIAMGVAEKAFAGGDTPWELALKIDKQRKLSGDVVPAAAHASGAGSKVAPAVYDPASDETYVTTASAEEEVRAPIDAVAQLQGIDSFIRQPSPVTLQAQAAEAPNGTPTAATQRSVFAQDPFGVENPSTVPATPNLVSPEFGDNPRPQDFVDASAATDLLQLGEQALRDGNLDQAREYFREAWASQGSLDETTRQRLQEHLTLLNRPNPNPSTTATAEDREEAERIRGYISNVRRKQQAIARELRVNPKDAWQQMKELRANVGSADLPEEARRPLVARLDEAVRETEAFIDENRSQIELDARNREVLALVDRERKLRVEIENKLAGMVDEFNEMMDQQRYSEAYVLAKQAREMAPNNVVTESMIWKSRFAQQMYVQMNLRDRSNDNFLDSTRPGNLDTPELGFDDPIAFMNAKKWKQLVNRRDGLLADDRSRYNPAEQAIERALREKVEVNFNETPLSEALDTLSRQTGINVFLDVEGLAAEGVTSDTPVTMNLTNEISLKSVLNLILGQHRLAYIIQDEVLRITSEQARAGDTITRPYYVGDLVIPIPNFLPGYNSGMAGALAQAHAALGYGPGSLAQNRQPAPLVIAENDPQRSQNVASPLALGNLASANSMPSMENAPQAPGALGGATGADFDTLINLITSTVSPNSWDDVGGPGAIESFEGNLSLVISNTQEVHDEIVDLLEQLRRLQDLQVTIEVRFVTLQDNFFERIGVDFDFDINDNSGLSNADLAGDDFDEDGNDITIGLDPNGNPTLDLDLSFSQNSFGSAVPAFGGFDPGAASTFGFAILSDIEAFFIVEAIQGDTRTNVMQAPKITMFNGQFANITDQSQRPFVTSVVPVVGDFAVAQQPIILVLAEGTQLSVQAVVSSDRRFVRLTMLPMFSQIGDVDTFTFEGRTSSDTGSSTETDPDDTTTVTNRNNQQFTEGTTVQLPNFAVTSVSTTVSVPDGGTVLMGGIKRLAEGRNERGMPILSKLPYVNRLFKNVAIGRETQTLMMMVTPRIIIQEEEEERVLGTPTP